MQVTATRLIRTAGTLNVIFMGKEQNTNLRNEANSIKITLAIVVWKMISQTFEVFLENNHIRCIIILHHGCNEYLISHEKVWNYGSISFCWNLFYDLIMWRSGKHVKTCSFFLYDMKQVFHQNNCKKTILLLLLFQFVQNTHWGDIHLALACQIWI